MKTELYKCLRSFEKKNVELMISYASRRHPNTVGVAVGFVFELGNGHVKLQSNYNPKEAGSTYSHIPYGADDIGIVEIKKISEETPLYRDEEFFKDAYLQLQDQSMGN